MIVSAPRLLSDEWMPIGRKENTGLGGRIDLLVIAPDASLVLIELKRDRTSPDVVAQAFTPVSNDFCSFLLLHTNASKPCNKIYGHNYYPQT